MPILAPVPPIAPSRSRRRRRRGSERGFTLIELLVVIGVVGILAALTLSLSSGARERASLDRAQAELAVLATALESYRSVYGSYPDVSADPSDFYDALTGRLTPTGEPDNRRPFITLEGLAVDERTGQLVDPWGMPYHYQSYRAGPREGYWLYSRGRDGVHVSPAPGGAYDENADENLDNVSLTR